MGLFFMCLSIHTHTPHPTHIQKRERRKKKERKKEIRERKKKGGREDHRKERKAITELGNPLLSLKIM